MTDVQRTEVLNVAVIAASLDEVRANVAHADAQYNPWALQALRIADLLLADYRAARRDIDEMKAQRALDADRARTYETYE